jgi:hypothetical protein
MAYHITAGDWTYQVLLQICSVEVLAGMEEHCGEIPRRLSVTRLGEPMFVIYNPFLDGGHIESMQVMITLWFVLAESSAQKAIEH